MTKLSTLAPFGLGLALLLSACSAGGTTSAAGTSAPAAAASGAPTPAGTPGARTAPGVSGKIAYVSGQLMQVQDTSTQTAVTWTASTAFTSDVPGTLANVVTGTCVVATTAVPRTTGTSTAAPTDQASASGAATRVAITDPVDGACAATGFPGAGGFPAGGAGGLPSGFPTAMPDGAAPQGVPTALPSGGAFGNGGRAFGGRTAGMVTAVSGTTISVQATTQDGTTNAEVITVDAATTYTRAVKADASAVVVGQCATAIGPADSSGKVTATSVTVSAPVNGTCSSFTGRGGAGLPGPRNGNRGGAGSTAGTQGGSHA